MAPGASTVTPPSEQAVGMLIAFLETGGFASRKRAVLQRLDDLSHNPEFADLPDDLQEKVLKILAHEPAG